MAGAEGLDSEALMRARLLALQDLENQNINGMEDLQKNLVGVIDKTTENNRILVGQGEQLRSIDRQNEEIERGVNRANRVITEMERTQFLKKAFIRGIAFLMTVINILLFLKMFMY